MIFLFIFCYFAYFVCSAVFQSRFVCFILIFFFLPNCLLPARPRSMAAPVRPRCPETLVLGSSNSPMCALAPYKFVAVCGRARKGCCLIPMLAMHPCIHSRTLSRRLGVGDRQRLFLFFGKQRTKNARYRA
jgi:hypothetical protein